MNTVTVRVPATSANLGPGFDCLALALELYNEFTLEPAEEGVTVHVDGEGAGELPQDENNLVAQAALRTFEGHGRRPVGLRIRCHNRIPLGSGLGSSAAAVVGGICAANAMAAGGMSDEEMLFLAYAIEGHADNAAAAFSGGLNLVRARPSELIVRKLALARLEIALAVPGFELPTESMRQALPDFVQLADAVDNLGSLGLLIEGLRTGDHELLREGGQDRLHQPHRLQRIPGAERAIEAAYAAGASLAVLSGAGPGVLALAPQGLQGVAEAMAAAFEQAGHSARALVLAPAEHGATVDVLQS